MKKILHQFLIAILIFQISGCAAYYRDEVLPPTEQEIDDMRRITPEGALQDGVFHMQRVQSVSSVRVRDRIQLKRPDLPPFDVAYISRNLESILLELANAAGESIVIPQGIRNRTVTLVHSGVDFEQMLDLVLRKAGYHYNYIDGVWYITRYPIRNYVLEISQSDRKGSLRSDQELGREEAEGATATVTAGTALDSEYTDEIWEQVESTITELIGVGQTDVRAGGGTSSSGITGGGRLLSEGEDGDGSGLQLLPPPSLEGSDEAQEEIFGTLTESGGLQPTTIPQPESTDHLIEEEDADPWFRVTKGAGLLTVRAAPEAHRLIEEYLAQIQESLQRQVYVEARIVAIVRDRTTDRGTDYNQTTDFGNTVLGTLGFRASTPVSEATKEGGFISLSSNKNDLSAILQSISTVADVYTISSPGTLARNNQISRISLTRQLGFAETEVEQNTLSDGTVVIGSRTDTVKFKNSGTVMSVMPYIGKSKVHLRFRLSIASKSGDTPIQTRVGTAETITNLVPELSNNLIDQDMVLDFGRVYAIGSLVETSTGIDGSYAPMLNLVPGLSEVFRRATNRKQDTEFVVLLKVTRV